jgi:lipid-binding SYLF domain-containing protein
MNDNPSKNRLLGFFLVGLLILVPWLRAAPPGQGSSDEETRVSEAGRVFQEIAGLRDETIPESILKNAQGIAIIPGIIKAAYGIGGEYGRGVLLVQEKGSWSNPSFVTLAGGSVGWQIGVQRSDLILVFKTRKSIDNIAQGKVTLGADAGVAAGPVGRGAQASTDLSMKAEIYAYSKAKGLFIGVSIKGAAIQIDADANRRFYGDSHITAESLFSQFGPEGPPAAVKLREMLAEFLKSGYRI